MPPSAAANLADVWIPVGLPGFTGDEKARRQALLDGRYGSDGWRLGHVVRGQIVSPAVAIAEYEASYRTFLRANRSLLAFLAEQCGNVYDNAVSNVYDDEYLQPHTTSNHYQDISVRRVIAELVDDPAWPEVTPTEPGEADLLDLGTGRFERVPRAVGHARRRVAADPRARLARVHAEPRRRASARPGADHHASRTGSSGTTSRAAATCPSRRSGR